MSIFCIKKLTSLEKRIGRKLKEAREAFGINLETAGRAVRIPAKYLEAIEKNKFSDLPKAKVYRLNYLREYAKFLNVDEAAAETQFIKENGLRGIPQIHPAPTLKNAPVFSIAIFARNILGICLILLFAGYLTWQVKRILEPPLLNVYSPIEGYTTGNMNVIVQGETEKECRLAINGQEIMVDESGRFNSTIDLSNGLNTIIISATKKHGKTSTVTRHVVVKGATSFATPPVAVNQATTE